MRQCKFMTTFLFICILLLLSNLNFVHAKPYDYAKRVFACYEGDSSRPYIDVSGDIGIIADTLSATPIKFKDGNSAYKVACKRVNLITGEAVDCQDCIIYRVMDKIYVVYDLEDMEGSTRIYSLGQDNFDLVYDALMLISKKFYIEDLCFNDDLNHPYTDLGKRFDNILDISSSKPLDTDYGRGYAVAEYSIIYGTGRRIGNGRLVMLVHNNKLIVANARKGGFVRERFYTVDEPVFYRYYYAYRLARAACADK